MMEGFCKSDEQKRGDSEVQKRYADPIAGLKKSADKKQIEQQKQKKRKCQIKLVGIHHDVVHIWFGMGENSHAQQCENPHEQKAGELDHDAEGEFAFYCVRL